jgi:hypothetical protein
MATRARPRSTGRCESRPSETSPEGTRVVKNPPYIIGCSVLALACGSGGGVSSAPIANGPNLGDSGPGPAGNGGDATAGTSDDAASANDDEATASDAAGSAESSVDAAESDGATAKAPALVQHVSASNTRGNRFASPYCYYYQLPDPTTAGDAVVVGFTFSGNATPSVKDDKQDTYAIAESYFDAADKQSIGVATAFGVSAGARVISLCFSADPGADVQPMATEFANVTALDGAGAGAHGSGTAVTPGSLTPSASGDLAYQVVASLGMKQSSFAAGNLGSGSAHLLSADVMDGWAGQYGVAPAGAFAPTMSMGASDRWLSAAILLRAGSAGGVPAGMRIVHLVHENVPYNPPAGGTGNPFPNPLTLQFPSSGNLLVAMEGGGNAPETVTSVTDSNHDRWSQAGKTYTGGDAVVQAFYAGAAASSEDLALSVDWSDTRGDYTFFLYDVTGAAASPLDTTAGGSGSLGTAGSLKFPFTLTPAAAGEIVFSEVMWDFNTGSGLTGQLFDTNTFSGESESGPEPVDENNGWGHVITTTAKPVGFTWTVLFPNLAVGAWAGMAAAFK